MFTVLSWNIQQGGGTRIRKIVEAIQQQKANVVILSEFRNNDKGRFLRDALLKIGYRFQAVTSAGAQTNSVIIAANYPFNSVLHPKSDKHYAANIIEAQFDAFNIVGVYLPHKKRHKLLSYLIQYIKDQPQPYIIAGDYNTGINGVDQEGNSFWYQPEMRKLNDIGMIDAYRLLHHQQKEYSWYSHQGNGYRYDHTYVDQTLSTLVTDCRYLHTWRENKLADHSPMLLTLST